MQSEVFRHIAETQTAVVVNIRTESRRQTRDLTEFFGRGGLERFFGLPLPEIPQAPGGIRRATRRGRTAAART